MDTHQFDEETMRLASFKLLMQNNAMLRSLINGQAQLMAMIMHLANYQYQDAEDYTRAQFEDLLKKQAELLENISLKESWEWASINHSGMDKIIQELF